MEFKETRIALLTKEDKALLNEVEKARLEADHATAKAQAAARLFWEHLRDEHHLSFRASHYIRNNNIYKYDLI